MRDYKNLWMKAMFKMQTRDRTIRKLYRERAELRKQLGQAMTNGEKKAGTVLR